jgi:uncharacterized protein
MSSATASADYQKGLDAARAGDFATALREWRPLADQGDANAQGNLGFMYDGGEGVPEDDVEAVKWYRLAADQGYADDTVKTGRELFNEKFGVPDSAEKVAETEQKVADKEKYDRIYNSCLLDKSLDVDMRIGVLRNAVHETCASIADNPSWLENFKYN